MWIKADAKVSQITNKPSANDPHLYLNLGNDYDNAHVWTYAHENVVALFERESHIFFGVFKNREAMCQFKDEKGLDLLFMCARGDARGAIG